MKNTWQNVTEKWSCFHLDKLKLKSMLEKISQDFTLNDEDINNIKNIEQKWKQHESLFKSLSPFIQELEWCSTKIPKKNENSSTSQKIIDIEFFDEQPSIIPQKLFPSPTTPKPSSSFEQIPTLFNPTPSAIHSFFTSQNIIGEETNRELLIYALLSRTNIGIESLSGSGKSALLYATLNALPPKKYLTIHQATAKSLYNNPNINTAEFWIVPELQKIFSPEIEEIIKNLTEGVSTTYTRTNTQHNSIDTFTINKKCVLYSFAITNRRAQHRDDEFYRHFIVLHTDISKEKNKRIAAALAEKEVSPTRATDTLPFQNHLTNLIHAQQEVKNPFLPYLIDTLPEHITSHLRFRSSQRYLNNLIKGCTLYHHLSPHHLIQNQKDHVPLLFSTLFDNQHIISLYEETLFANLYGLSVIDKTLLDTITEQPTSIPQLTEMFYDKYSTTLPIEESINKLLFLQLIEKNGYSLQKNSFAKITIDIETALFSAQHIMQQNYPQYYEEWHNESVHNLF